MTVTLENGTTICSMDRQNCFFSGLLFHYCISRQGVFESADGDKISGTFVDGKIHGRGKMIYAAGGCVFLPFSSLIFLQECTKDHSPEGNFSYSFKWNFKILVVPTYDFLEIRVKWPFSLIQPTSRMRLVHVVGRNSVSSTVPPGHLRWILPATVLPAERGSSVKCYRSSKVHVLWLWISCSSFSPHWRWCIRDPIALQGCAFFLSPSRQMRGPVVTGGFNVLLSAWGPPTRTRTWTRHECCQWLGEEEISFLLFSDSAKCNGKSKSLLPVQTRRTDIDDDSLTFHNITLISQLKSRSKRKTLAITWWRRYFPSYLQLLSKALHHSEKKGNGGRSCVRLETISKSSVCQFEDSSFLQASWITLCATVDAAFRPLNFWPDQLLVRSSKPNPLTDGAGVRNGGGIDVTGKCGLVVRTQEWR